MDHREVGRYWNRNAEAWTKLAREGYDLCRDQVNTPAFLDMLPEVSGRSGLDIGCGEGYNTRLVAGRGAHVTALDISEVFLKHAQAMEDEQPRGIRYLQGSALELPFADHTFDFVTSFMCLMDVPDTDRVLAEAYRVLRPGGFFQFSITHPCFDLPHRKKVRDEQGQPYAYELGGYFHNLQGDVTEWIFGAAPPEAREGWPLFQTPRFTLTLAQWFNSLVDIGFVIEHLAEPCPDEQTMRECPYVDDMAIIAYFLIVRCRKPGQD